MERQGGPILVSGHQTYNCGQVSTGTVPTHGDLRRVAVDGGGVLSGPLGAGVAIIGGAGEFGFRRQPVVHRHDYTSRAHGQVAGDPIGDFQVSQNPTATVEPNQYRKGPGPLGRIDPHRNLSAWTGNVPVFHLGYFGPRSPRAQLSVGPRFLGRYGVVRRQTKGGRCF